MRHRVHSINTLRKATDIFGDRLFAHPCHFIPLGVIKMCTVDWAMLLGYFKVVLSWPAIAFFIVLVVLSRFREAIENFLNRLVEGNFLGQVFRAVPPSSQDVPSGLMENKLAAAAAQSVPVTAIEPAENLPPELAGDPAAPTAVAWVKANPAMTVIEYKRVFFAYNAERLFIRIYGTQVALLESLRLSVPTPLSMPKVAKFHSEHQLKTGTTAYQLRDYIKFLMDFGVLTFSGAENHYEYQITQHGVEFLSYIKASYPTNWDQRPG